MDRFPLMLYRSGGALVTDSGPMATLIVGDASELDAALADGWHESSPAAAAALAPADPATEVPDDDAPPTRDELEQKAAELGIKIDGRWGDKRIADAIAAALKA